MRGREKEVNFEALSEKEKGYLFGMFEGDGYKIHDEKSRHYSIEFYLNSIKDQEIIEFVSNLLIKINTLPYLYQDKRYNCKRIRVYSKQLFGILNKNISIKDKNKEFCIGYCSGIIDSEGYVNYQKAYILIVNTKLEVLKNIKKFLKNEKIESSISKRKKYSKDKLPYYQMYISVKFKSIKHLSIKVRIVSR